MRVIYLEEVGSTNDEIWKIPLEQNEPLALIAKKQSSGKGTRGKSWVSVEGNFYGSFKYAFKSINVEKLPFYSVLAGIRIVESLKMVVRENLMLMWPNDLVVDYDTSFQKVGGILCESKIQASSVELVVGVGINLKSFPEKTEKPAGKINMSLEVLTSILLNAFENPLEHYEGESFSQYDFFRGKNIRLADGKVGIGAGLSSTLNSYKVMVDGFESYVTDPLRPQVIYT